MFKTDLRKEADSALGVLSGALKQLHKVSEKAIARISSNKSTIDTLQSENDDLTQLVTENNLVENNINKLLGKQ